MTKCYVSRWISSFYDKLQDEYFIHGEILAITETKEEALEAINKFRVPKYYPDSFHLYLLIQDFPVGINTGDTFGNENVFFKYTKAGLVPIDWDAISDEDRELSEIFIAFANPNKN